MIKCFLFNRLAYCLACPEDLYIIREVCVIIIQFGIASLPGVIISCRAEYGVIYIAFCFCPIGNGSHNLNDSVAVQTSYVITQDSELAYSDAVELLEFCQKGCGFSLNITCVESAHKRMCCPDETAFYTVSDFDHLFDRVDLFFRIQFSPLGCVVRVILWCENIRCHLKVTAEFHQGHPVFVGPRDSIVSFDKSADIGICIIFDRQVTDRFVFNLVENVF